MNRQEFLQIIDDTFAEIHRLNGSKGKEYASDANALANLYNRAEQAGISPEKVWAIYFGKHVDSIYSYIRTGQVFSEPIEGRIHDAILYLILLLGLVSEHN